MTDSYTNWDEVPLLLTTEETAAILRVHTNTVKYLIHSGQLAATKIAAPGASHANPSKVSWIATSTFAPWSVTWRMLWNPLPG